MTTDFRALCAKVLAYNEGQGAYNFSHLNIYDRDNAAFDAWQEIKAELKSALAEPEPERPDAGEVMQLADNYFSFCGNSHRDQFFATSMEARKDPTQSLQDFARAVLARWGCPAPQPVPVSERLPGPEDCDAEGECYWFDPEGSGAWYQDTYQGNYTHWLPVHALPQPS